MQYPLVLPLSLLATCIFLYKSLSNTALLELKCSLSVAIIGVMVISERLRTTDCGNNFSKVKQRSQMQVYSSRFPSLEPKTER